MQIEVVSAQRPSEIVEQNVGAGGRRVANGTYTLDERPDGATQITFQYSWQRAPLSERLLSPFVRSYMRRADQRAMERLAQQLTALRGQVAAR